MFVNPEYLEVHADTLAEICWRLNHRTSISDTCFSTVQMGILAGEPPEQVHSYYDGRFYDEEDVALIETTARLRGMQLWSLLQAIDAIRHPEDVQPPLAIDTVIDKSAVYPSEEGYVTPSVTTLESGAQTLGGMYVAKYHETGVVERLVIASEGLGIFAVSETIELIDDPEMDRVTGFMLPLLNNDEYATLLSVLTGRVSDIEKVSSKLLSRFVGTAIEDEMIRMLDVVVDRGHASRHARALKPEGFSTPDVERLSLWLERVS